MCLESYHHFRCGHTSYLDADPCPYLEEVHHLIESRLQRHRDARIDRLYQSCEDSQAKRYLRVWKTCPRCESCNVRGDRASNVRDVVDAEWTWRDEYEYEYVGVLRMMVEEEEARKREMLRSYGEKMDWVGIGNRKGEKKPIMCQERDNVCARVRVAKSSAETLKKKECDERDSSKESEAMQL